MTLRTLQIVSMVGFEWWMVQTPKKGKKGGGGKKGKEAKEAGKGEVRGPSERERA